MAHDEEKQEQFLVLAPGAPRVNVLVNPGARPILDKRVSRS